MRPRLADAGVPGNGLSTPVSSRHATTSRAKWGLPPIASRGIVGDAVGMNGTIVCGVTESPDARNAADLAHALGRRLGLRLVLVSVVDCVPQGSRESLERTLDEIAREIGNGTEQRVVVGDRAEALAQIAAEEGADLIVLGSRPTGLGSHKLRCTLARELEATTPLPVLVAPPSTRKRSDHRLSAAAGPGAR